MEQREEILVRLDRIEQALSLKKESEFVNLNRVVEITGLSKNTLYKYISEKSIPVKKFGRLLRFNESLVLEWMRNRIESNNEER